MKKIFVSVLLIFMILIIFYSTTYSTNITTNISEQNVKLTDFIGSYGFSMDLDGPNTIEITKNGEGLKINWVVGPFNGSDAITKKVEKYTLNDNKLMLKVEEDDSNYVIFKENGKTYFTIEGIEDEEGFSYFPIEMMKKVTNTSTNISIKEVLIVPPAKNKYKVGENLDLTGLAITAIYDNNKIEQVDINKNKKDYKVTGFNNNKEGKQTLTITYKGFSRSFNVQVGDTTYDVENEGKLPQTGDFSILKGGLYILIAILSSILIFIIYKSFKYNKA